MIDDEYDSEDDESFKDGGSPRDSDEDEEMEDDDDDVSMVDDDLDDEVKDL